MIYFIRYISFSCFTFLSTAAANTDHIHSNNDDEKIILESAISALHTTCKLLQVTKEDLIQYCNINQQYHASYSNVANTNNSKEDSMSPAGLVEGWVVCQEEKMELYNKLNSSLASGRNKNSSLDDKMTKQHRNALRVLRSDCLLDMTESLFRSLN